MERRQRRQADEQACSGRARAAVIWLVQSVALPGACVLWTGLALPGLQLIPGVGDASASNVAISLQSALLGLSDNGPEDASMRNALRAPGLQPTSLQPGLLKRVPHGGDSSSLLFQLNPAANTTSVTPLLPSSPQQSDGPHTDGSHSSTPPAGDSTRPGRTSPAAPHVPPSSGPPPGGPQTGAPPAGDGAPTSAPPQAPAPSSSSTLAPQAIAFRSTPPSNAVVGGTYTVSAAATSGLPVTFSASSSAGVCTVSGSTVSFVGAGTCTVAANQPGDATYAQAAEVEQSFGVRSPRGGGPSLSSQTITFTSVAPPYATLGGSYTVSASATSGLPVTYSVDAGSAGVCSVSGDTVSFLGAGLCGIVAQQPGNGSYAGTSNTQSFSVYRRSQTISFGSTPPGSAVAGGPAYAVSATSSSGLAVVFSADSSSAGVCLVSGSTVTPIGAGTCVVNADQFGDATYAPAPEVQQSFAVGGAAPARSVQSISFTSTPPSGAVVGGSYIVGATSSSGLLVSFSADASSAGACTVSGTTVSFTGVGACAVDADQAGNASYQPAPQVQQSFVVRLALQTITFTSAPPGSATVGSSDYVLTATSSSGLAVAFSADAAGGGSCTVSGSTVSLVGAGTCVVDADQAGDSTYAAAPQAQQSFTISPASKSPQTINFTSTPPAGATIGGRFTVAATASSGLAVSFSADGSSAGICAVSGASVSFTGNGTCVVDADQSGNGSYQAAPEAQQSFAIGLASQTITFTSSPPAAAGVGDPDYTLAATASSGLAVSFSADGSSAGVCTVSGSSVSLVGAGTCTIDAAQSGNATYAAAPQAQQSFTIGGGSPSPSVQSITFTSTPPSGAVIGGTYVVSAVATSGLAVTFGAHPSSTGVCSVSGSTVSFVGSGLCTIDANQAGNANYQPAPQVQQSIAVGLTSQTIAFTSAPPPGATVGGSTYTVTATASSGLTVTFTIYSASAGVCTISGSTVSPVGSGTCTIDANQSGNGAYAAAPQVQQSFTISGGGPPSKSVQSITFTSTPPSGAIPGGTYTVSATTTSGLGVTFSADASSAGVCSVSGSAVSLVGRGTCTVDANQAGNATYQAAPQAQQSFGVGGAAQTITYTSTPPSGAIFGASPYTVSATASSGLPVTFSIDGSSGSTCSVSGSTVTLAHAGTCTVDADQSGNGTYAAAPQAQQSFTIGQASQTISITSSAPNPGHQKTPYTIIATASSGLAVTFSVDPSSAGVCSASGSTITFAGKGQCTIYADQPGDTDWLPAPQVTQSFFVNPTA